LALILGGSLFVITAVLWWQHTGNVSEAHRSVREGGLLLDVDTAECYAASHLDGAVHIPVEEIARRRDEIGPLTRRVVVYARTGGPSRRAARTLRGVGYHDVRNLGPMTRWVQAGMVPPRATPGEWFRHTFQRSRARPPQPPVEPLER
jgi:phage shock protein E